MRIYNREVGPGHPTFIVAEGGSNHGGSLDAALALTDVAVDAGADAMKWQLWLSADEMYDVAQFPDEHASAARWRLPAEWLPALRDRAHERGMAFGLSSFGFASLDVADGFVDFHKVASIEAAWKPFVRQVFETTGKPVLVSQGMMQTDEKLETFYDFQEERWRGAWLVRAIELACTVSYPCDMKDAHLASHPKFRYWGLSDHTTHPTIAPCAAVALGACVIEKHIRLEYSEYPHDGHPPDYDHALPPIYFEEMVSAIRLTEQALGSSEKRIRPSEEPYLKYRRGPKGLRGS